VSLRLQFLLSLIRLQRSVVLAQWSIRRGHLSECLTLTSMSCALSAAPPAAALMSTGRSRDDDDALLGLRFGGCCGVAAAVATERDRTKKETGAAAATIRCSLHVGTTGRTESGQ